MIRYGLRRHASIFATVAGLAVYGFILPEAWGWWLKLPLAGAVAVGVSLLLSRPPAKRY